MPCVTRFPGFRSRSIAYGNASRALPIGRMSPEKILPWIFLGIGDLQSNSPRCQPAIHGSILPGKKQKKRPGTY